MKKNRMMRLASILLVCVLLTTSVISGTFAKYVSSAYGTDTARVAKWAFTVGGTNIAKSDTFTFDLINTVYEVDGTTSEEHLSDTTGNIIAPGTGGYFEIQLKNDSEVTAKYAVEFEILQNNGIPVEFSTDNGASWTKEITSLNIAAHDTNTALLYNGGEATVKVQWRWAFTGEQSANFSGIQTDETDTALGVAAADDEANAPKIIVKATVTATQVD